MKRYQMSESLPVGLLLALAGGILDSYTYLNRGQVFATAETGNLVLLGIHLAQGELGRVLSCLFPSRLCPGRPDYRGASPPPELRPGPLETAHPGGGVPGHPGGLLPAPGRSGRPGQCAHRLYQRHPDREFPKICRLRMRHHHVHRQPEERHRAPIPLAPPP